MIHTYRRTYIYIIPTLRFRCRKTCKTCPALLALSGAARGGVASRTAGGGGFASMSGPWGVSGVARCVVPVSDRDRMSLSPRCGVTDMSPTNSLNSVLLPAPFLPTRATRDVWPSLHETLFKTFLSEPAYLKVRRVRLATVLTLLLQPSRAPGLGKRIAASELPVTCAK
jgi:hypothetical protein